MNRLLVFILCIQFSYSQAQEPWILENNDLSAHQFIETNDGGLIFVGSESGVSETGKIIKYDVSGNMLWEHTIEDNDEPIFIFSVIEDFNGDLIVGGQTFQYDPSYGDGFLMRIDACGEVLWFRVYGEIGVYDYIQHLVLGDNHEVYLNHYIANTNDDRFTLTNVDVDGTILWQKQYFTNYGHGVNRLMKTGDKGFIMIGTIYIQPYFDPENPVAYLRSAVVRTDSLGSELWINIYRWEDDVSDSIQTSAGGTVNQIDEFRFNVVGLNLTGGNQCPTMYELDDTGALLWYKNYPNSDLTYTRTCSSVLNDTVFMVAAYHPIGMDMVSGQFKVWKTDLNGTVEDEFNDESISYSVIDVKASKDSTSLFILPNGGGPNLTSLYAVKINPSTMSLDTLVSEDTNVYDYYCPEGVEELNYYFPDLSVGDVIVEDIKQLRLAPNPAKNFTYLYFDIADFNRSAKLEIHNIQGTLMKSYPLQATIGRVKEDLSSYTSGIYLVSLVINNRVVETQQMVVE